MRGLVVLPVATHLELVAIEIAQAAAAFIEGSSAPPTPVRSKSTATDVVTETDLAAETLIRRELAARCPGSSIVGEEYDESVGSNGIRWIVDPIDGTVNFVYGLPVVSVSIAAAVDGKVVAGAVVDIQTGDSYSAAATTGARRNGKAIQVGAPTGLDQALIGTGFSYESGVRGAQAQVLTRLLPACRDIRCMGSAALNLCWVGAGLLDGYFERDIKLYDYAAGALIAAEAGAVVELPPPGCDGQGLTMAAAPAIAAPLADLVAR